MYMYINKLRKTNTMNRYYMKPESKKKNEIK